MDNQPLITIITVTYNAERFLERTLKSVHAALARLENPNLLEYLIIDGKSTDGTLGIAENFRDMISRVVSEKDDGLYDAMNKGTQLATGKYLWFLNAGDELYHPHVLSRLIPELQNNADIYYSDAMMIRENGSEVGLRSVVTPHRLPNYLRWQDFSLGMKVCHQAFIVKREIAPSYNTRNLSADIDWEINSLKSAQEVIFLPFILCKYLLGGLSVQNHRRSLIDRFWVLKNHFGLFPTLFAHLKIIGRAISFRFQKGRYW
jgi:glycosyltransferase involved in cell wall biosynthesis